LTILLAPLPVLAELQSGPPLPYHLTTGWAQLPAGWNFGEVSGVDVDKNNNVCVSNRRPHPVVEFDSSGKMLQAWPEIPIRRRTASAWKRTETSGRVNVTRIG
jgi:hypothetical protein